MLINCTDTYNIRIYTNSTQIYVQIMVTKEDTNSKETVTVRILYYTKQGNTFIYFSLQFKDQILWLKMVNEYIGRNT